MWQKILQMWQKLSQNVAKIRLINNNADNTNNTK